MSSLKDILKNIDQTVKRIKPSTMDELINVVHLVPGAGKYGTSFSIVKKGRQFQGVRVRVIARSKSHVLPSNDEFYPVVNGMEKFEKAGWQIENK